MTAPMYGGQMSPSTPPTKNRLPVILASAVALVGLAVGVIIVVVGKSGSGDDPSAGSADPGGNSGDSSQTSSSGDPSGGPSRQTSPSTR